MRALELFSGIGGFSAAVAGRDMEIVAAFDQSDAALDVYRLNFPGHDARQRDLERVTTAELAACRADIWWLSPPCQPYSVRGAGRDLDDPRARSLLRLIDVLRLLAPADLPLHLALENVPGFIRSRARILLTDLLSERGYRLRERLLCPTELGIPSRRPRYYLAASRQKLIPPSPLPTRPLAPLAGYLNRYTLTPAPDGLQVAPGLVGRFGAGFRIIDPDLPGAYTTCFTGSYGKSLMHAGSYLRCANGVRRFAPDEIARLLHFPPAFRFPDGMGLRARWHLLGNSLSVAAVREILGQFPGPVSR